MPHRKLIILQSRLLSTNTIFYERRKLFCYVKYKECQRNFCGVECVFYNYYVWRKAFLSSIITGHIIIIISKVCFSWWVIKNVFIQGITIVPLNDGVIYHGFHVQSFSLEPFIYFHSFHYCPRTTKHHSHTNSHAISVIPAQTFVEGITSEKRQ